MRHESDFSLAKGQARRIFYAFSADFGWILGGWGFLTPPGGGGSWWAGFLKSGSMGLGREKCPWRSPSESFMRCCTVCINSWQNGKTAAFFYLFEVFSTRLDFRWCRHGVGDTWPEVGISPRHFRGGHFRRQQPRKAHTWARHFFGPRPGRHRSPL